LKIEEVAAEILPDSPGFVRLLIDMADPNQQKEVPLWNYLSGAATRAELSVIADEYNLPATGMTTDYDASLLFSYCVRIMTYPFNGTCATDAVYIFMDEIESLPEFPNAAQSSIRGGMRGLIDACTEHLFLVLASTGSDASEMWGILDNALMQRLSREPLALPTFEDADAKTFIKEVMKLRRIDGYANDEYWPFDELGFNEFVNLCPDPKTPRKLLVSAQRILRKETAKVIAGNAINASDVQLFDEWAASF